MAVEQGVSSGRSAPSAPSALMASSASFGPLIRASSLQALIAEDPKVVLLDCGFDLFDPQAGRRAWAQGHLPGAVYAHLDEDLSGPKSPNGPVQGGRHPLPDRAAWAQRLAAWGISPQTRVVAYDDQGGPYAARAWWLLRWAGHEAVAVLDGGRSAWVAAGGTLVSSDTMPLSAASGDAGAPASPAAIAAAGGYPVGEPRMATIDASALQAGLGRHPLVDARAGERYRGETEPLDTRAGHIPGAINRFFKDNLLPDGRFKPAEQLRREWSALVADGGAVVHQCGSGVTACHNLLAVAVAGLGEGVLYPGSWSEWSADPGRPCAVG